MIYLDHHAATPLVPGARQAVEEALDHVGNPSSVHVAGRAARRLLERAREEVALALGSSASDLVFTSGGSEAVGLGVLGVGHGRRHVVTTTVEHPSLGRSVDRLEAAGARVERLAPGEVADALDRLTSESLLAVQWVNHETGDRWPVEQWTDAARAHGAAVVIDASQALGKLPVDVSRLGADAVAVSAHKAGGPAGAGALWVGRCTQLEPVLLGGGQERGRRAGSPGLAAIAGFGGAMRSLPERLASMPRVSELRDRLEVALLERGAVVNRGAGPRVPTACHVSFRGARGATWVVALDLEGVCVSSGAACSSGIAEPSPVLRALYPTDPARAEGALRFTLGPETTPEDIEETVRAIDRIRARKQT